ncbi:MAG: transglutaminase-like domain-containing protein [Akkermansiaceae bacterium]
MITETKLPYLIKLLDDKEPATQAALVTEFAASSGDLSNELTALGLGLDLSSQDKAKLTQLLLPARRKTLMNEWQIPAGGRAAMAEDWDSFEYHLRLISDYLHDGISLRPPLSDALDIIADEFSKNQKNGSISAEQLRIWMFADGRFQGNKENYYLPQNSDLCFVADSGLGNPISLTTLFMLVGRRLNLDVSGCNYPGHFLARIYSESEMQLVDCFHKGRLIPAQKVIAEHKEISINAKIAIAGHASLGDILWRFIGNIEHAFKQSGNLETHEPDLKLFASLSKSLNR